MLPERRKPRRIKALTDARERAAMRRKAKAKKRARAQRQAKEEARQRRAQAAAAQRQQEDEAHRCRAQELDAARPRRAQTAAARAAHSARHNPSIRAHDALVLPEIVRLRGDGLSWARIARELEDEFVPPGWRAGYPLGDWHATAVWRIARRHGVS